MRSSALSASAAYTSALTASDVVDNAHQLLVDGISIRMSLCGPEHLLASIAFVARTVSQEASAVAEMASQPLT